MKIKNRILGICNKDIIETVELNTDEEKFINIEENLCIINNLKEYYK